jgi:hypothetical protein
MDHLNNREKFNLQFEYQMHAIECEKFFTFKQVEGKLSQDSIKEVIQVFPILKRRNKIPRNIETYSMRKKISEVRGKDERSPGKYSSLRR